MSRAPEDDTQEAMADPPRDARARRNDRVLAVVVFSLLAVAGVILWPVLQHRLRGWTITVTNGCDYDLMVNNGHGWHHVAPGKSVEIDHVSESLKTPLLVVHAPLDDSTRGPVLRLVGDTTIAGSKCPDTFPED